MIEVKLNNKVLTFFLLIVLVFMLSSQDQGVLQDAYADANNRASAWYRSSTGSGVNFPKNRTWSGTAWGSEVEQATAGSPIRGIRIAYDPTTQGRYVAAMMENDGTLDAYVCTASSCVLNSNLANLSAPANIYRPFDVAFEKTSGEALIVYGWISDTTNDLAYRTLATGATTFGSEVLLDDATAAYEIDYSFVYLATRFAGSTDYIGLFAQDTYDIEAVAAIWSGSAWGDWIDVTYTAIESCPCLSLAWERSSGDLIAVAERASGGVIGWRTFSLSSGWSAVSTGDVNGASTDQLAEQAGLKLQADVDITDTMMLVALDGGASTGLFTSRWNGTSFETSVEHDTAVDAGTRVADFGWEPDGTSTEDGLLVWGTTSGQITRKEFNAGGWAGSSTDAAYAGTKAWVQAVSNPLWQSGENKVLFAVANSNLDLGAVTWNGTTFTIVGESTFTADLNEITRENFALAYNIKGPASASISETLTVTDSMRKGVGHAISELDSLTDSIRKATTRTVLDAIAEIDSMLTNLVGYRNFAESLILNVTGIGVRTVPWIANEVLALATNAVATLVVFVYPGPGGGAGGGLVPAPLQGVAKAVAEVVAAVKGNPWIAGIAIMGVLFSGSGLAYRDDRRRLAYFLAGMGFLFTIDALFFWRILPTQVLETNLGVLPVTLDSLLIPIPVLEIPAFAPTGEEIARGILTMALVALPLGLLVYAVTSED